MRSRSPETNLSSWLDDHRVINASGTMTSLGASSVSPEVAEAVRASLPYFLNMHSLQALAGRWISRLTGAEAGCVTASVAAGIAVGVAACIAGMDWSLAEALPDSSRIARAKIVLQKGHHVDFGSSVGQMIRLGGGTVVEVGSSTSCRCHQLEGALDAATAGAVYVISHHTVQSGMIGLKDFISICHARNVAVIVDAASEYDLRVPVQQDADIVLYSAHKFLGGLTAGIIAGKKGLVRACYLHQNVGIGRAMKVGKEGIVGTIAALQRWHSLDHRALHRDEYARALALHQGLSAVHGLAVEEVPDPTGNPITRIRVSPSGGPLAAMQLARALRAGSPPIYVRDHHVDLGYFELDPCNLMAGDVEIIITRIQQEMTSGGVCSKARGEKGVGPRHSRYYEDGLPGVEASAVPWLLQTSSPSRYDAELLGWPEGEEGSE
jgi:D-glucosaminate-6-phosphate ammonia-lyase